METGARQASNWGVVGWGLLTALLVILLLFVGLVAYAMLVPNALE